MKAIMSSITHGNTCDNIGDKIVEAFKVTIALGSECIRLLNIEIAAQNNHVEIKPMSECVRVDYVMAMQRLNALRAEYDALVQSDLSLS